jgi:hypothetical protein
MEENASKAKRQFYQAIINHQYRDLHRAKSQVKLPNESYLFYFLFFISWRCLSSIKQDA